jgi:hypothetical protein
MHLLGQAVYNDDLLVVSRGNRSLQWIHTGESAITVTSRLRDARLDDPVDVDPNDRRGLVTVADFTARKIMSFETTSGPCAGAGADAGTCPLYSFDGELSFPGTVYRVDTTNVN